MTWTETTNATIPANWLKPNPLVFIKGRIINLEQLSQIVPVDFNDKYSLLIETPPRTTEIPFETETERDQVFEKLKSLTHPEFLT